MISRLHLSAFLFVAAVVSGVVLLISGVAVKLEWLTAMSATITVVSLLLLLFQHVVWRWQFLHGWFVEKPDLNGTWSATLKSDWKDPESGEPAGDVAAFLAIRQTYSHLSIRLMTRESSSELVGSSIHRAEDGVYRVTGVYRNEPMLSARDRSPIHYGAVLLDVQGDPPSQLVGQYWTDRDSAGELRCHGRIDKSCASFDDAITAFSKTSSGPAAADGSDDDKAAKSTAEGNEDA